MPTSLRIALFAGLLALISNLAVIGFIQWRTHDEAVSTLRRQVTEQEAVLADVYESGGMPALKEAIEDSVEAADPEAVAAVLDASGRPLFGNVAAISRSGEPLENGYRNALVRLYDEATPREAALVLHHLRGHQWLASGRIAGEGLAIRDTLERSLLIALALAVLLGLACGLILAHYVGLRIRAIATVARRISGGDLSQRVPLSVAEDAFDGLGRQINQMLDRISSLMSELRMLTDTLAHDLRSPVGRLRAAADAAIAAKNTDEREQQLASVIRQADSLMRILTTVLEIGRSEALTGRNQFSWFEPGELGAELSEMYEPVAEEAGAELRFNPRDPLPAVFGHRQLLAQAVSNLIENAIRYGAEGGDIRVIASEEGGLLKIGVADKGPGIPRERHGEALRRFGRLDSSRSAEGAGLGLALAEAIAHLHGGELVLSDNRPGLLASLELPLRSKEKAEKAALATPNDVRLCAPAAPALGLRRDDRPEDPLCAAFAAVPGRGKRWRTRTASADRVEPARPAQISRAHHARPQESGAGQEQPRAQGWLQAGARPGADFIR